MRQGRDLLGQHLAIGPHVRGAHLHQIVEISRNQMALLDLGNFRHRRGKGRQRRLACILEPDLDKGHMIQPQADRIEQRPVTADHPGLFQPPQPRLGG